MHTIASIRNCVEPIAKKHPIKRISLFGSYAEGNNTEYSDIDFLAEFYTDAVSLIMLNNLRYELEDSLGIKVDLIHGPLPKDSMLIIEKVVPIYES